MKKITKELDLFLNISKIQPIIARKFESRLGGLGYNEFVILYYLGQSTDEKMRRVDLANKLGLTPSGITRLLLPMEKVGYIKRGFDDNDARVSYVMLAPGGKQRLNDRLEDVEILTKEIMPADLEGKIEEFTKLLVEIGRSMVY